MREKVMVAVDNRGIGKSVLAWLADRGNTRLDGPEIEIVTVAELGWMPAGTAEVGYRNAYEQAQWEAEDAIRSTLPGAPVTGTMLWGIPVEQLTEASSRADLLVLGSDKTGTISGFISGTVPLRVVAHSACPTVVVPSGWRPGTRLVVAGIALAPSDDAVLEFAAQEAERLHGALRIVHAVPLPRALLVSDLIAPATRETVRESAQRQLATRVGEVAVLHPGLPVTGTVTEGDAAQALVDEAAEARLVVVGTHGRGLLRRIALGSVSHDLLLNTACPVAVVHNGQASR